MAKTKTAETPAAATSQPWAAPAAESATPAEGGNGGGDEGPASSESDTQNELTPEQAVEQAVATAPTDELPAEVKDQVTPSGQNPSEAVEEALAPVTDVQEPAPGVVVDLEGGVSSEERDQVTPHGVDVGRLISDALDETRTDEERELYAKMSELDEDEHREIEQSMREHLVSLVNKAHRGRIARSMELNLIDSTQHYGTRATAAQAATTSTEE